MPRQLGHLYVSLRVIIARTRTQQTAENLQVADLKHFTTRAFWLLVCVVEGIAPKEFL
jgi:hypothetical protein